MLNACGIAMAHQIPSRATQIPPKKRSNRGPVASAAKREWADLMTQTEIERVQIVEVGPRDGYQGIQPFIPTDRKLEILGRLVDAGLRRIEIGSIVSRSAVPQMADTAEIFAACASWPDLQTQVLVPTRRRGLDAVAMGVRRLVFVLSVSELHNRNNVRCSPLDSVHEYEGLIAAIPQDVAIRLDVGTSFDCPFSGRVSETDTLALLACLADIRADIEVCFCDTTGRADPAHVSRLFSIARLQFPQIASWAFHGHDTYGLGAANALAAFGEGVRTFDAAFAGLGGCPFAPGATGNVATEDLVWMFERMNVTTGINLQKLIAVAEEGTKLPGGVVGGRVRQALGARERAILPILKDQDHLGSAQARNEL